MVKRVRPWYRNLWGLCVPCASRFLSGWIGGAELSGQGFKIGMEFLLERNGVPLWMYLLDFNSCAFGKVWIPRVKWYSFSSFEVHLISGE